MLPMSRFACVGAFTKPTIARECIRLLSSESIASSRYFDTSGLRDETIKKLTITSSDQEPASLELYSKFASTGEQLALVTQSERRLKRILGRRGFMRYEPGHFDNVIKSYKEAMISDWGSDPESDICRKVLERIKGVARIAQGRTWLDAHILELSDNGEILPHIDHVNYSGDIIVGLSLLSSRVLRFERGDESLSVLLQPGSLYIQRGFIRNQFTHSIPLNATFRGDAVDGRRRLAIILRDKPSSTSTLSLGERFSR